VRTFLFLLCGAFSTAASATASTTIHAQDVVINEYLPAPVSGHSEFVELLWRGSEPLEVSRITFRDSKQTWSSIDSPAIVLPGELFVLAKAHSPFPGSEEGSFQLFLPSSWPALNNSGDSLVVAINGVEIDRAGYRASDVVQGRSRERISVAVSSRLSSNWRTSEHPDGSTPGAPNTATVLAENEAVRARVGDLLITEIMFNPLQDAFDNLPDQMEFIEVMNVSGHRLSLNGIWLSSLPDENGRYDSLGVGWIAGDVAPESLAVLFRLPTSARSSGITGSEFLSRVWPSFALASRSAKLVPLDRSLSLSNQGELIVLNNGSGESITEAWYEPGMHHPIVGDGKGVSLERSPTNGVPNSSTPLISSTHPEGATPGYHRSRPGGQTSGSDAATLRVEPASFYPEHREFAFQTTLTITTRSQDALDVVSVNVYDLGGRHQRTLVGGRLFSSTWTSVWDGRDDSGQLVPMGFYIVSILITHSESGQVSRLKKPVSVIR